MTFKTYLKLYIKNNDQVSLGELEMARTRFNSAYNKHVKSSTMERELRSITARTTANFDLLGYRIETIRNSKGYITGYSCTVKPQEIKNFGTPKNFTFDLVE